MPNIASNRFPFMIASAAKSMLTTMLMTSVSIDADRFGRSRGATPSRTSAPSTVTTITAVNEERPSSAQ